MKLEQNKVIDFTAYKIMKEIHAENVEAAKADFYGDEYCSCGCEDYVETTTIDGIKRRFSILSIGDSINNGYSTNDKVTESANESFNNHFIIQIQQPKQEKSNFWTIIWCLFLTAFIIGVFSK